MINVAIAFLASAALGMWGGSVSSSSDDDATSPGFSGSPLQASTRLVASVQSCHGAMAAIVIVRI